MLTSSRIVYLVVYVNDLERSREFYESTLGYGVVEEDAGSVKYDAGHAILCLNRARDYGITLAAGRDNSVDIVFLVDDLPSARAALEQRDVQFTPTVTYEIGAIADFYDPDGHWLTLYQPSSTAMGWPSGAKIRAIQGARRAVQPVGAAQGQGSADGVGAGGKDFTMDCKELLYIFMFVRNANSTCEFYRDKLGLLHLEGGPCSQGLTSEDDGVVKYDAGGVMIATHHIEGTVLTDGTQPVSTEISEHSCPPREMDPEHTRGVAPVFHVAGIDEAVGELSIRGVRFPGGVKRSAIGAIAEFADPSGHMFYLYEPSAAALRLPSGDKLKEILAAPL
jgi:predicted enzyme related to lactoylglutathione lyase